VEPDDADPSPLELPLSSEPELLDPLELLEPLSSELLEVAVVPLLPLPLECFADTTATETPVAPTPRTAVAIAAAEARCNQRRRVECCSSYPSVLTMPQASPGARQPHSKGSSSHRQVLLKVL